MQSRPTLSIIGGTGALGSGLAMRWAAAGYAVVGEALTAVLIGINRRYKVDGAGIRITALGGGTSAP